MKRPPLADIAHEAATNAQQIRDAEQSRATKTFQSTLDVPRSFSGDAFIEEEQALLAFDFGTVETGIYTSGATRLRTEGLRQFGTLRDDFFFDLLEPIAPKKRILNLGCGEDLCIERAATKAGHAVAHTDLSALVIESIITQVDGRAFACNLRHLGEVLPSRQFDLFLGNSVLGYVSPVILEEVLSEIAVTMPEGAIFSFDLTPNSAYFSLLEGETEATVANSSSGDPRLLEAHIDEFGPTEGPAAFVFYHDLRAASVQAAVIEFLRQSFEEAGFFASASRAELSRDGVEGLSFQILRVARKSESDILKPLAVETPTDIDSDPVQLPSGQRLRVPFLFVDRERATRIWRKLGRSLDHRKAPWELIRFLNSTDFVPSEGTRRAVEERLGIQRVLRLIRRSVKEKNFRPPAPMSAAIEGDQVLRSLFIRRLIPSLDDVDEDTGIEFIDQKIDALYSKEKQGLMEARVRARDQVQKGRSRARRSAAKAQRKRNRKK